MTKRQTIMRSNGKARRTWNALVKEVALKEGIPDSYRQVIMFLNHNPGASQKSIAEFSCVTTSAINQVVKSMLSENYITKEADENDKRGCRLYLTDKGLEVAQRLHQRLDEADAAITNFLGKEKEKELIEALDSLADFIKKELLGC